MLKTEKSKKHHRRASVITMVAVTIPVLLGFAALAIDVSYLFMARAQLQNAADAAALAGASVYFTDEGLAQDKDEILKLVEDLAPEVSLKNETLGSGTILELSDIQLGRHDWDDQKGPLASDGRWNAVQVMTRRTSGSSNGPVDYFIAGLLGFDKGDVVASARATAEDRAVGVRVIYPTFIPFTIDKDTYEQMVANGPDQYSYDNGVQTSSDGVGEIKLYPWVDTGNQKGPDAAGNFGTLNIGVGNQGSQTINDQLLNGIPPAQIEAEFGTNELRFYDENGNPKSYIVGGNPGLSTSLKDAASKRIGDIVAFFLHNKVKGGGATAKYEIVDIRYGRIMHVDMTGKVAKRKIVVQPMPYVGPEIIIDEDAPSTGGQLGTILLVQ